MAERSPYAPMLPSDAAPNPLRPYYRPPSIGATPNASTGASIIPNSTSTSATNPTFGSSARNILSDLNYNEFLGEAAPTTSASVRSILDQLVWKYTSVILAQPFEVAKTVLQVRLAESAVTDTTLGARVGSGDGQYRRGFEHEDDEDEDDDEPSYFTSSAPQQTSPSRRQSRRYQQPSPPRTPASTSSASRRPQNRQPPYRLDLRKNDSLTEVISQLWSKEGSWGIYKGTNVTFLYSLILKAIETWTRSMLSAMLNLPDPGMSFGLGGGSGGSGSVGGLDIIDSPSPMLSLGVAVVAAGLAGVVCAPLDVVRTRIILTPTSQSPRTVLATLRTLRTYLCPSTLLAPTLLHSTIPALFSGITPLFLRSNLGIDPILTPSTYTMATFLASGVELFTKLPVETVLRRGQIQGMSENERRLETQGQAQGRSRSKGSMYSDAEYDDNEDDENDLYGAPSSRSAPSSRKDFDTVVEVGPYTGLIASMWRIAREEGTSAETLPQIKNGQPQRPSGRPQKGQGVHGLWRGWRVGAWGLVGVWGLAAFEGGRKGGEF